MIERNNLPKFRKGDLVSKALLSRYPVSGIKDLVDYEIAAAFGKGANLHIRRGTGRYDAYWHRRKGERTTLVHHGGAEGFPDVDIVGRQNVHVILGYVGIREPLPALTKGIGPGVGQTFPELVSQLNELVIPGEQQRVNGWINTLQEVNSGLLSHYQQGNAAGIAELAHYVRMLIPVQSDLLRSTNPHKQLAAQVLGRGLAGSRAELLTGISQAQLSLFQRAHEAVSITLGTMDRHNALDREQISWREAINWAFPLLARISELLRRDSEREYSELLEQAVRPNIRAVKSRMTVVIGEPYFSRAQRIFEALEGLEPSLDTVSRLTISTRIDQQTQDLRNLRDLIRQKHFGIDFGRFELAEPN